MVVVDIVVAVVLVVIFDNIVEELPVWVVKEMIENIVLRAIQIIRDNFGLF